MMKNSMVNSRKALKEKMKQRIFELSRKYPYACSRKSGYKAQMILTSFGNS